MASNELYPFQQRPEDGIAGRVVLNGWLDKIWRRFKTDSAILNVTASTTVPAEVQWVRANATGGAITITLPLLSENPSRTIGIIKFDSSANEVTVTRSGTDLIAGVASRRLSFQWHRILLKSNGAGQWDLVSYGGGGTYTPTLTNVTNLGASTTAECQFLAVDNVCTVGFRFAVDPTAAALTELGISLPVPSNFGVVGDCGGTSSAIITECGLIEADVANNRASLQFTAVSVNNHAIAGSFTYEII